MAKLDLVTAQVKKEHLSLRSSWSPHMELYALFQFPVVGSGGPHELSGACTSPQVPVSVVVDDIMSTREAQERRMTGSGSVRDLT